MREGWKTMKLDDACFVDYGTRVVRKKDGGTIYPVYGGGGATFQMDIYNRENCLVVARFAMSQACTRFVQGKFFLNDSGLTLRAKDKDLSQQFLDWIIISKNDLIYSFGKGSAQKNLDMEDFRNMYISFPVSLPEQQRIVDILDREFAKIDALKANAEKSLQAAKDLFQATLKKELEPKEGWSINRLGDICTITSSKRIYKNEYVPDGIPFYRTKEVKEISNGRPISVELYISRERYNEIKQKFGVPQPNDILVSAVGTIGEMMIVRDNSPFYFKDGNLVWLKGITNADPEYLRYYLQSVINQIKGMTIGAAYSALTIEKFQEMEVALAPSLLEQQAIVSQLDDLNGKCKNLQDNYQKTLTLCDDLKQSLLHKAFNGEL